MPEIKVLDSSIYNKISAGEVVERPASVVKELIENSIDAGAKNITIEIKDGGCEEIIITDDGCGIENQSVKTAFLSHATSKIKEVEDLEAILTLGFRGEALASIAAVAHVEMVTKTESDDVATKILIEGGEVKEFDRCSAPSGTKINVSHLFYNVPARKKFLKKSKLEEHDVTSVVQKLILANPNISFRYIADGKQMFYSTGKSLEDAIMAVYGLNTLENVLKIEGKVPDKHIYGYIGKPSFTKSNRTYQTLIVNNRIVNNMNVSIAVLKGYETHLMKGQFPFFVLFLDVDPEKVDVNVHPTKLEVRFEDNSLIFSFVYKSVSKTIMANQELYSLDTLKTPFKKTGTITTDNFQNRSIFDRINEELNIAPPNKNYFDEYEKNTNANHHPVTVTEEEIDDKKYLVKNYKIDVYSKTDNTIVDTKDVKIKHELPNPSDRPLYHAFGIDDNIKNFQVQSGFYIHKLKDDSNQYDRMLAGGYKIAGKLFNTYLFIEHFDEVIIIDQHAAHERLLYDELLDYYSSRNRAYQPLVIPYILDVNAEEKAFIDKNLDQFINLGFIIEEFGSNAFKISQVPLIFNGNFNAKAYFDDVLASIDKEFKALDSLHFNEYLMQKACKAAVKAGNDLSENEISHLIFEMKKNNTELFCPHGRPIAVKISKKDIEKWFKRVL